MNVLVICTNYPSVDNLYAHAFIHKRLIFYKKKGYNITVFVMDKEKNIYNYEGINVIRGKSEDLNHILEKENISIILIHFITYKVIRIINKINLDLPLLIWVHLGEAISWKRRLFNYKSKGFIKSTISSIIQINYLRKFVKKVNSNNKVKFIFVSKWIKETMESDINLKVKNYEVIHNIIDTDLFNYIEKNNELRKKILMIRPFTTNKYANDIAVEAIIELSKLECFNDIEISIYGKGDKFDKLTLPLKKFNNINLNNKFLNHKEIVKLHKTNGIFLCPTRQDSQGVSMCEAMSSGLIPITSNNSAIPEFVENGISGILVNKPYEIAKSIEFLYYNSNEFSKISKNAAKSINKKCNFKETIAREINAIEDFVNIYKCNNS